MKLLFLNSYSFFIKAALLAVVLISLISNSYFMGLNPDGTMNNCVFMDTGKCTMTLSEHLNLWQQMFTATSQKVFSLGSLMLVALLAFLVAHFASRVWLISPQDFTYRLRFKQKFYLPIFDPIKEAYSQGILNPKIYNLATI